MVFDIYNGDIIEKAIENRGNIVNGHAIYDTSEEDKEKRLKGFYLFNNESPHPDDDKYYIYLFTVHQNTNFNMQCYDCPFDDPEGYEPDEYSYQSKEQCCLDYWVERCVEDFDDDHRDNIEHQIREIIDRIVSKDLDKINTIRNGIYKEFYSPTKYQKIRFDYFELKVMDELVDNAYECGLYAGTTPKKFLKPTVDELARILTDLRDCGHLNSEEGELAYKIENALNAYNLNKALELLK